MSKSSRDLPKASLVNLAGFFHQARLVNMGTGLAKNNTPYTIRHHGRQFSPLAHCMEVTASVWECNKEVQDTLVTLLQVKNKFSSANFHRV